MTPERLMEKTCFTCMVVTPSKPVGELLRIGTKRVKIMTSGLHIWMKAPVSNQFIQYSIVLTDSFGFELPELAIYITLDKKHPVPCCRHDGRMVGELGYGCQVAWVPTLAGVKPRSTACSWVRPLIHTVPPLHPVVKCVCIIH